MRSKRLFVWTVVVCLFGQVFVGAQDSGANKHGSDDSGGPQKKRLQFHRGSRVSCRHHQPCGG